MDKIENYKKNLYQALGLLTLIISVFVIIQILASFGLVSDKGGKAVSTITLSGHGEVNAAPDIATVSFNISKDAKTVKEAQEAVAKIEKAALDILKTNNIADKDIKTSDASFYPKYEYKYNSYMPCTEYGCPPPGGKNVIVGYTASESISVKIRNIDTAGKIIQELGTTGVSDLNGPNFSIDKEDDLKAQARKLAIDDAQKKAKVLAKDLGVRLGKVSSFNEGGNYGIVQMYSLESNMMVKGTGAAPAALPKGENTISSDVTITYEIR